MGQPILGPVAPSGLQTFAVDLDRADLFELTGMYSAQPALLTGDRAHLWNTAGLGDEIFAPIFGTEVTGAEVSLAMGNGCYAPGFQLDCGPWNLAVSFPDPAAARVEITPQSFEVYTWIYRDFLSTDHRVTITFDAARAGPDGEVLATTAYSIAQGWTPDVNQLSGTAWDFVRFEVQFELDVSGDGYDPLERSPVLDFIKVPVDFRR